VNHLTREVRRLTALVQPVEWDAAFPAFRRVSAHAPFGNRPKLFQPS